MAVSDIRNMATNILGLRLRKREGDRARRQAGRDRLFGAIDSAVGRLGQVGENMRQRKFLEKERLGGQAHEKEILGIELEDARTEAGKDRQLALALPNVESQAEMDALKEEIRFLHGNEADPNGVKGFLAHQLELRRAGSQPEMNDHDALYWEGISVAETFEGDAQFWNLEDPEVVERLLGRMMGFIRQKPNVPEDEIRALESRWRATLSPDAGEGGKPPPTVKTGDETGAILNDSAANLNARLNPSGRPEGERITSDEVSEWERARQLRAAAESAGNVQARADIEAAQAFLLKAGTANMADIARRLDAAASKIGTVAEGEQEDDSPLTSDEKDLILQEIRATDIQDVALRERFREAARQVTFNLVEDPAAIRQIIREVEAHLQQRVR